MQNDTYIITGYDQFDGRPTVLVHYRCYDIEYDTQLFLDSLTGSPTPTADELTTALTSWLTTDAKPQLAPTTVAPTADLEALIAPIQSPVV